MGEEKSLKVGDIIRKFSSQSDLTTDSKAQATQHRKHPLAHESPTHTSLLIQAQVAKIAEPSLEQSVSSEPIDINELRKKKPSLDQSVSSEPIDINELRKKKPSLDQSVSNEPIDINELRKKKPSLDQSVSSEPIDINELRKRKPHISL
ncbi:uncharacterized protein LOC134262880 [Saccostrea cucullata]|uniref:uncharacterized protein LOC134262880 n=1 Tax=Saccostrea cuccullata TaxID=36930 RepID=UPI002ED097E7